MTKFFIPQRAQLNYPQGEATNDSELLVAVLNALHHQTGVPSDHVRVEVNNGVVILNGVVGADYEKTLAEQAAASAPGVVKVENRLTLSS